MGADESQFSRQPLMGAPWEQDGSQWQQVRVSQQMGPKQLPRASPHELSLGPTSRQPPWELSSPTIAPISFHTATVEANFNNIPAPSSCRDLSLRSKSVEMLTQQQNKVWAVVNEVNVKCINEGVPNIKKIHSSPMPLMAILISHIMMMTSRENFGNIILCCCH